MPDYHQWLAATRQEALDRGGKPLCNLSAQGPEQGIPFPADRKPGEIINPLTGEIVTGCVVLSVFADALGITTHKLTDRLEALKIVQRVLKTKDIPMVCAPQLRKPEYYLSPEATRCGILDGLIIPIQLEGKGIERDCLLLTPEGQKRCRATALDVPIKPATKIEERRQRIKELLDHGKTQAEISRVLSIPKQTISRITHSLR